MMQIIWRLCTFQAGPQDVPYSLRHLYIALFVNFALQFTWLSAQLTMLHGAMVAFLSTSLLLLFAYVVVNAARHAGRFLQTALALQWVNCVLHALLLFAIFIFQSSSVLLNYYLMFAFIWGAALFSHIIKEAITIKVWQAILIVLAYIALRTVCIMGLM